MYDPNFTIFLFLVSAGISVPAEVGQQFSSSANQTSIFLQG